MDRSRLRGSDMNAFRHRYLDQQEQRIHVRSIHRAGRLRQAGRRCPHWALPLDRTIHKSQIHLAQMRLDSLRQQLSEVQAARRDSDNHPRARSDRQIHPTRRLQMNLRHDCCTH